MGTSTITPAISKTQPDPDVRREVIPASPRYRNEIGKFSIHRDSRCIACGKCELACAFAHGSDGRPAKTRINIHRRGPDLGTPIVCLQCDSAACKAVCPVDAIDWNESTGALEVSRERCIRCRMCVAACPLGRGSASVL